MEMLGACLPKTGCQEGVSTGVVLLKDAALHVPKAYLPQQPNADQRTRPSVQRVRLPSAQRLVSHQYITCIF